MKRPLFLFFLFLSFTLHADEGMWMLHNLNKETRQALKELGLEIPVSRLFHPEKPSISDAIVSFGGFCSGVVVSEEGLILTNHHCGFSAVQQHSSIEKDYIREGFTAHTKEEELPNIELFARFLVHTENVTRRVLGAIGKGENEMERSYAVDSVCALIQEEAMNRDTTLFAVVEPYYEGNEYYLSVYKDYNDVRLVYAPPSSIGKFGWDTDNWEWPRHTGDFCLFRVYAGEDNQPADYSPDNQPYRPRYVVPLSTGGYREGSFCMTMGYPGSTERYRSSFGIVERMTTQNEALITIRGIKQEIWKKHMDRENTIRIKYASKYDESSNYWKNSIGMNQAIKCLKVVERKQAREQQLRQWVRDQGNRAGDYLRIFPELELGYRNRYPSQLALSYFIESFFNSAELLQLAIEVLNFDFEDEERYVVARLTSLLEKYANMDLCIDKEVFTAILEEYPRHVDPVFLPSLYEEVKENFNNSYREYADYLYGNSKMTTPEGLKRVMQQDSTFHFFSDPAISLAIDLIVDFYDLNQTIRSESAQVEKNERLLNEAVRKMYSGRNFYPDANSTLRLSLGTVRGYSPADGVEYRYFTTTDGIFEKAGAHRHDPDFTIQRELLELFEKSDFGEYAAQDGKMNVCFISDNDITGGNSGSPMLNGKGELIGLAFDGNWEAMSSDFIYEPDYQRCIGVDIRYVLFIMEKYSKADNLVEELKRGSVNRP